MERLHKKAGGFRLRFVCPVNCRISRAIRLFHICTMYRRIIYQFYPNIQITNTHGL